MLRASIKSNAAFASSYTRGMKLAKAGKVLDCIIDDHDESGLCELTGKVSGSSKMPYSAWVKLDLVGQEVLDYDCSCPANANYMGMCKHAIALALTYLNNHPGAATPKGAAAAAKPNDASRDARDDAVQDAYLRLAEALGKLGTADSKSGTAAFDAQGASKASAKKRKRAKPEPSQPTSEAIISLMRASAALAQHEAAQSLGRADTYVPPTGELADFSVTIARSADPYSYRYYGGMDDLYELRLRIRCGKASYVVKRFDKLMVAWEEGSEIEYGKNLTLRHVRSAFTDRAAELLDYLSKLERSQRALFLSSLSSYRYGMSGTNGKTLSLSSADAIAVLDIMQGSSIVYECEEFYSKKTRTVKVVKGNPRLEFKLERATDGGWSLHVPQKTGFIRCDDDLYVIDKNHAWRCSDEYTRRAGTMLEELLPEGSDHGEPFHIAEADMPVFCERILPMLEAQVGFETPDDLADLVPPEAEFSFRIGVSDGIVAITATVAYDEMAVDLFDDLQPDHPVRDIARELAAQATVRKLFPNGYVDTPDYSLSQSSTSAGSGYHDYGAPGYGYGYGSYRGYDDYGYGYGSGYGAGRASASGRTRKRQPAGLGAGPGVPWFPEDDVEALYTLLTDGLAELAELGEVFLAEKLRGVHVQQAPEVRVEASVAGGLLDLSVNASGLSPADLMRYLSSYRRKQRYVRLSSGDIMKLGAGVQALSELADGLGLNDGELIGEDGTGGQLPANRTLFVDALMKEAPGVRFDRDESFRAIVRTFDTIADSDFTEPDSLRDTLRSYQRTGFKWLSTLDALGFGGILADEMGLGKTLQVIALLLARKLEGADERREAREQGDVDAAKGRHASSLVVCPASLVYNWLSEIERFAPEIRSVAIVGPAVERRKLIASAFARDKRETAEDALAPDVLVTSYDLMKRDIESYAKAGFDIVVLDEAHYIKNPATKSAKAAKRLRSHVRFALTGTPIENRLTELWSIFDFLMPGILGSSESFAKRFERPISSGRQDVAERLRSLVSPFILRRLKGDVLTDLPDKNENVVFTVMEGEQDKLYKANADRLALELSNQMPEEFAANRIAILAELTRLRQICCDPRLTYEDFAGSSAKLETCVELVSSAIEEGHAILLFSQFTSMLDLIAERLRKERISYFMLTGATSKEKRMQLVHDFQEGLASVFLISLKAGGVGLNLTAADIVIHYDPWWNLSAQNQATDRTHRIGQTRDVSVFKLIAKGTIEEKIVEMQEAKFNLAESVIGGQGAASATLTRDDILALLEL